MKLIFVAQLLVFKQSTKLEEQRKIALDEHLNFIVDQTEKMSTLVAESLMKSANNSSASMLQNQSILMPQSNVFILSDLFGSELMTYVFYC